MQWSTDLPRCWTNHCMLVLVCGFLCFLCDFINYFSHLWFLNFWPDLCCEYKFRSLKRPNFNSLLPLLKTLLPFTENKNTGCILLKLSNAFKALISLGSLIQNPQSLNSVYCLFFRDTDCNWKFLVSKYWTWGRFFSWWSCM